MEIAEGPAEPEQFAPSASVPPTPWKKYVREIIETVVLVVAIIVVVRVAVQNFKVSGTSMTNTIQDGDLILVNKIEYAFDSPARGDVVVFRAPCSAVPEACPQPIQGAVVEQGKCLSSGRPLGPQDYTIINGECMKPASGPAQDYIKRLIGLPGDDIRIKGSPACTTKTKECEAKYGVWVNGKKLDEPYIRELPDYNWPPSGQTGKVPPGNYFVLGDNRTGSFDSHAWNYYPWLPGGPGSNPWVPRNNIVGKAFVAYWPLSDLQFFSW